MMDSKSACNRAAVYFVVSFRQLCLVTVSLPLCGLLICFITAYIFQQDDIHETHCRVYNVIPSISAITGISPQRYLWRICIALHIGPRILIASVYHMYYLSLLPSVVPTQQGRYQLLLQICYWLNLTEITSLCGVTYISNRENYLFMFCSLSHMLATIMTFSILRPQFSEDEERSYNIKRFLFATSIASTLGLMIFFLKHRLLCHDMAFSWFSLCEYIIASANMAFHITVVLDFPTEELIVAKPLLPKQEQPHLAPVAGTGKQTLKTD
ncbi:hypothetical protein B566_EDAN012676 [Ephemera danica]|nr:hypothetical protein B566_EDAN012676 [Ephemera danica]